MLACAHCPLPCLSTTPEAGQEKLDKNEDSKDQVTHEHLLDQSQTEKKLQKQITTIPQDKLYPENPPKNFETQDRKPEHCKHLNSLHKLKTLLRTVVKTFKGITQLT